MGMLLVSFLGGAVGFVYLVGQWGALAGIIAKIPVVGRAYIKAGQRVKEGL